MLNNRCDVTTAKYLQDYKGTQQGIKRYVTDFFFSNFCRFFIRNAAF